MYFRIFVGRLDGKDCKFDLAEVSRGDEQIAFFGYFVYSIYLENDNLRTRIPALPPATSIYPINSSHMASASCSYSRDSRIFIR